MNRLIEKIYIKYGKPFREHLKSYRFLLNYPFAAKAPITVFHHIPKCGGLSIASVFDKWFIVFFDIGHEKPMHQFIRASNVNASVCLHGHYHVQGFYLWQRFPDSYDKNKYRLISFIRDPFETLVSKYYYNVSNNLLNPEDISLKAFLMGNYARDKFNIDDRFISYALNNNNYLSMMLGCNPDNYKEMIDRYFFIGLLEEGQRSLDVLAAKLNKPRICMPHVNKTSRGAEYERVKNEILTEFRARNQLDYSVYKYCKEKFLLNA